MPDDITQNLPSASAPEQTTAVETQNSESTRAQFVEPVGGEPPIAPPGYELLEEVGRGGMGVVFRARDVVMDRDVAVKFLRDGVPPDSPAVRRFLEEARITGRLQHPGIPPVHQVGTFPDGRPFLAMKLIRGRTLADMLNDLDTNRTFLVAAFERVCEAVGYAHSEGIIHRDLKPANIMIGAFGEVQVMDWGLAREMQNEKSEAKNADTEQDRLAATQRGASAASEITTAGAILGTPAYMAPEQARGEPVDRRADVFALGGVLCTILTGKAPFLGADSRSVLGLAATADLTETFARLEESGGEPELIALCKRCLAPDPAGRPEDAKEVADAVAGLRAAAENRARRAEAQRAAAEVQVAEQWKRRQMQFALAVMVMCFIATGGLFAWWNQKQKAERLAREREELFAAEQRETDEKNRRRLHRNAAIGLLLECETALNATDIAKAELTLAAAAKRVQESGDEQLNAGIARCRTDLGMLQDLDHVEKLRHTVVDGLIPSADVLHREWATAYHRFGIVLGTTPPEEAAERIHESRVGEQLLAGLDSWLRLTRNVMLLPILHAADPDEFRDGIREALATGNDYRITVLSARPEAMTQPARFAVILGAHPGIERERRKKILLAALQSRPGEFWVMLELGWISSQDNPVGLAEREGWYRAALVARPAHPTAWNNLGNTLQARGDLEGAAAALRKATELDPGHASPHHNLGTTLNKRKQYAAAAASFREAIRINPGFAPSHHSLGNVLYNLGDGNGAIAEYREAVRLDPKHTQSWNNLGNRLQDKEDWNGAIEAYTQALKLDPNYAPVHNNLGNTLLAKGDINGAVAALREAVRCDPKYTTAWQNLGNTLVAKKDFAAAVVAYREALTLEPKSIIIHNQIGETYLLNSDWAAAAKTFREGIKIDPTAAGLHNGLGIALAQGGTAKGADLDAAIEAFREAARLDPLYQKNLDISLKLRPEIAPPPREPKR